MTSETTVAAVRAEADWLRDLRVGWEHQLAETPPPTGLEEEWRRTALDALPWAAAGLTPLVLLLTYSGAVLAPLIALHLVSIVPFRLIEAFVELVTGGDPRDVLRPTIAPAQAQDR